MPNPTLFWPINEYQVENSHALDVDAHVNKLGGAQEQRINNGLAWGPRADGELGQTTYVGRNSFIVTIDRLRFPSSPFVGNANLDNSLKKLWSFYKACFYSGSNVVWKCFWFYNPVENDDFTTWTGDVPSTGTNSRGEAVTQATGRYMCRFVEPHLDRRQIKFCLYATGLEVIEVAPESVT
jgi:hypothetical protein